MSRTTPPTPDSPARSTTPTAKTPDETAPSRRAAELVEEARRRRRDAAGARGTAPQDGGGEAAGNGGAQPRGGGSKPARGGKARARRAAGSGARARKSAAAEANAAEGGAGAAKAARSGRSRTRRSRKAPASPTGGEAEAAAAATPEAAEAPAPPAAALPVPVDPDASLPALPPSESPELASALSRYMAELRHTPPISREEEQELARRWVEEGDVEAARRLVLANLRLVVKIAMEYRRAWTNVLDLIQEGNLGLLQAVQRFDPYQGVKLSSYAVYWIRAYILKYLLDNIRLVRLGTTRAQRKLFFRLNKEKRALEREGFEVGPKLLAERLDVSEEDVVDMEHRLAESDLSLDAPVQRDDSRASFGDFIAAAGASSEEQVADEELRRVFMQKVHEFAETLDERERRIVEERILAEEPKTLQELGDEFGVSRERVRQLEARVVSRLRDYLREHMVDFDYYVPPAG